MTATEPTKNTDQQSAPTLNLHPPRIPGVIPTNAMPDTPAMSVPVPSASVMAAAQSQRPVAEPLRFPQKISDAHNSPATQSPVQQRHDRTCVLPKGLMFTGEAHYPCDVRIDGIVNGKMTAEPDRTITVESEGKFKGSLKATNVSIEGEVDGDIAAAGGLASFGQNSVCKGHITYGRLKIAEGADVEASMKKLAA
jgi:cytoskeletal protein CcmA (bactofilin family)